MNGGLQEWGISLRGDCVRGRGDRAPLLGTQKDKLSKALELASVSIGARFWGTRSDALFLGALK